MYELTAEEKTGHRTHSQQQQWGLGGGLRGTGTQGPSEEIDLVLEYTVFDNGLEDLL